jgi:hypothetical protein
MLSLYAKSHNHPTWTGAVLCEVGCYLGFQGFGVGPYEGWENLGCLKGDTWTGEKEWVLLSTKSGCRLVGHPRFICSANRCQYNWLRRCHVACYYWWVVERKIPWFFCSTEQGFNWYCTMYLTSNCVTECALGSYILFVYSIPRYDHGMDCVRVFNPALQILREFLQLERDSVQCMYMQERRTGSKWCYGNSNNTWSVNNKYHCLWNINCSLYLLYD